MSLKKYVSHKKVQAGKITHLIQRGDGSGELRINEIPTSLKVSKEYMEKHKPSAGGYYVKYADGYESWSPAEAFEGGYREVGITMAFSQALVALQGGERIARQGWNGKDMYLELQIPDEHSKMTLPYIYGKTVQGDLVPWLLSQTDILAEDWVLIN